MAAATADPANGTAFRPGARDEPVVKPDAVVIALAAVAVIATTVAVMSSADWTSEETYAFAVSTDTVLPEQGPVPAGSAPARFEWPAPDNSTGILATVTVTFQGQAVQGGNAIIRISGTAPDGTQLPVQTRTLAVSGTQQTEGKPYNATWM